MKKIIFMSMLCLTLMQSTFTNTVMASEKISQEKCTKAEYMQETRKDIIEMKFRTYNGVKQYRRWNKTRNRWVDATWKNLN